MATQASLAGKRFGRLIAGEYWIIRDGEVTWKCTCDCGNTALVTAKDLTSGRVISCGCSQKVIRNKEE